MLSAGEAAHDVDQRFWDLVCSDPDLLAGEFASIIDHEEPIQIESDHEVSILIFDIDSATT